MKNKKLKKRIKKLEAIISPNKIKLTDPNDENHTVTMEINSEGNFETYHEKTITNKQKEVITQETNL